MAKYNYKVPKSQYNKNLAKSIRHMAREMAKTSMPSLSETVVSAQDSYKEIREFTMKSRAKVKQQRNLNKRTLLRPITEIIDNAKEDIATGKFYNEERINETMSQSMSDFLDYGFEDQEDSSSGSAIDSSSYKNFLATTSAGSMSNARAISETQIQSTEYLGELYQTTNIQNNMIINKYHRETMGKLSNIETLAHSLVDFNLNVIKNHISVTHDFYKSMMEEVHSLNTNVARLASTMDYRYTPRRRTVKNDLDRILGTGAFNFNEYGNMVKGNIAKSMFVDKSMAKDLFNNIKASPMSALSSLLISSILPSTKIGKTAGKLDKSVQGLFGAYLNKMMDWKDGNTGKYKGTTKGSIMEFLGKFLAPDNITKNGKPNLSLYKDQALTLEMENKKAKAITEVIPTYLKAIVKEITGKDKTFDYDSGRFVDTRSARRQMDRERTTRFASSMYDTREFMQKRGMAYSKDIGLDEASSALLQEDMDNFLAWITMSNGIKYKPARNHDKKYYQSLVKKGLRLRGGFRSFKTIENLIMTTPNLKRGIMKSEKLSANGTNAYMQQMMDESLINSGLSSLYNGFDDFEERTQRYRRSSKGRNARGASRRKYSEESLSQYSEEYKKMLAHERGEEYKPPEERNRSGFRDTRLGSIVNNRVTNSVIGVYDNINELLNNAIDYATAKIFGETDNYDQYKDRIKSSSRKVASSAVNAGSEIKNSASVIGKKAKSSASNIKRRVTMQPIRRYFKQTESHLDHSPRTTYTVSDGNVQVDLNSISSSVTQSPSSSGENNKRQFKSSPSVNIGGVASGFLSKAKTSAASIHSKASDGMSELNENIKEIAKTSKKKGKGMITGAITSTLLGLGPVPGAVIGALFSKKKKKSKDDEEALNNAEGMEEEKKKKKGFFAKGKNYLLSGAASTLLFGTPVPGILFAKILNKRKSNKEDKEDAEKLEGMEEDQNKKPKKKKRTSVLLASAATSLLGLGPVPGALFAMIMNKSKGSTIKNMIKDKISSIKGFFGKMFKKKGSDEEVSLDDDSQESNKSTTSPGKKLAAGVYTAKALANKQAKSILQTVKAIKRSDEQGKTSQSDKLEDRAINQAVRTGDAQSLATATGIIANVRNSQSISVAKEDVKNPEKGKGLFSLAGGFLSNILHSGGMGTIISAILGFFGIKKFKDFIDKLKGNTGHDTENEQGDSNFANAWDYLKNSASSIRNTIVGGVAKKFLGKKAGFQAYGATQSFQSASYYNKQAKAYKDRGANTLKQEQRGLAAQNVAKGLWYGKKVASTAASTKIGKGISSFFTKLLQHKKVAAILSKLPGKNLAKGLINAVKNLSDDIAKQVVKRAPQVLVKISSKIASILSVVAAWLPVVTAAVAFVRGCNNAYRDLGLDSDSEFSFKTNFKMRIVNGLVYALDDFLCGVIDICGLREKLTDAIAGVLFTDEEKEAINSSKSAQLSKYDQFLKDNDLSSEGFTFDMYNKMTNKSIWGKTKALFGIDELNKYKAGGSKNNELKSKYGGYKINNIQVDNSQNTNIISDGSTGSGGRGPSISKLTNRQIIQNARNSLNSALGRKSTRVTDEQISQYSKNSSKTKSSKESESGNIFTKIGHVISGAAKWVVNGVTSGFNWLKNKFTGGSGGRGSVDESNYYNQKDPRWGNQSFGRYDGKRDTVSAGGCGPTVAAMAMQELSGHKVLPSDMANLAMKAGQKYDNGGTDPRFFKTAANQFGLNASNERGIGQNAVASLRAGKPVPLMGSGGVFGNGTHYILANKMDSNGNVEILDPLNKSNNGKYNISQINKNTSLSTVFNNCKNNRFVKAVRKGRGFGRGADVEKWISLIKDVKSQLAAYKKGYSQSKYSKVTIGGKTIDVRTDCSGFVSACTYFFGATSKCNLTSYDFDSKDKRKDMQQAGFEFTTDSSNMSEGDILVYSNHIEIFARSNGGKKRMVYNCGSDNSCNTAGATNGRTTTPSCIWKASNAKSDSDLSFNSGSNGSSGTILDNILGKVTIKSLLPTSLLAGTNAKAADNSESSSSTTSSGSSSASGMSGTETGKILTSAEANRHNPKYFSPITTEQLKAAAEKYAGKNRKLNNYIDAIVQVGNELGIDPRWILANAAAEGGWDFNSDETKGNNFFGLDGGNVATAQKFSSVYDGFYSGMKQIKENYLDKGQDSFYGLVNSMTHNYTPTSQYIDMNAFKKGQCIPHDTNLKSNIYAKLIEYTGGAGGRGSSPSLRLKSPIGRGDISIGTNSPIKMRDKINVSKNSLNPARQVSHVTTPNTIIKTTTQNTNGLTSKVEGLLLQVVQLLSEINQSNNNIAAKDFSPKVIAPSQRNTLSSGIQSPQTQKLDIYESIVSGI